MADKTTDRSAEIDAIEQNVPSNLHPLVETLVKYQQYIAYGVGAIILGAAILGGVNWYSGTQKTAAIDELGVILVSAQGKDRLAKLEALLADAPSSVAPAIKLELAADYMAAADYAKAGKLWNELSGDTDAATRDAARIGQAKCLTAQKKFKEAITILKDLAGTVGVDFATPVYRQLAYAAEQAGDKATALAAYEKLSKVNVPDKLFVEARVAQLKAGK